MSNLPKCLVGMEACGGAHYWARRLIELGFEVKLMSPRLVKNYVENHKNDAKDAHQACAEAVTRGSMKFIAIKTQTQMDIQSLHRIRSCYVKQRTGLTNMMRGILLENGIAIPRGKAALVEKLRKLGTEVNYYSEETRQVFQNLYEDLKRMRLLKITKHGDRYIRQLLIHGGRSCVRSAVKKNKTTGLYEKHDDHSRWIQKLKDRVGMNKTSVAVANKNARIIVALLKNGTTFEPRLAH